MARIQFKGKVRQVFNMDDTLAFEYIDVPTLDRKHCDMNAMRQHPKYGAYANSGLFKGMLSHVRATRLNGDILRLDAIPDGVTVDTTGFLAIVSINV